MSHAGNRRFGAYCEVKGLLPEEQCRFRPDRPLKVVANRRLGAYYEVKGLLPEEHCRFRLDSSTTDMMFVVHKLQGIKQKATVSTFHICMYVWSSHRAIARVHINRGKVTNPARGQLNRENVPVRA